MPGDIRAAALSAIAAALHTDHSIRDMFLTHVIGQGDALPPLGAPHAALRVALHAGSQPQCDAAALVLRALFTGSQEAQLALGSTLAPLSGTEADETFGGELLAALCGMVRYARCPHCDAFLPH